MRMLHGHISRDGFRLRGTEASRIDGFSDVVFGFALTLLVVSLEVPHSFEELNRSLRDFVPFAICFLLLLQIWYSHYTFFRLYGLHDRVTIALNTALLFVVLYYVYPMKFLFTVITNGWLRHDAAAFGTDAQMRGLMLLYGVGFAAIFFLFTALYSNAARYAEALELTPQERFLTRSAIVRYALIASVGVISCIAALALPVQHVGRSGWVYLLLIPMKRGHFFWARWRLKRLQPGGRTVTV